MTQANLTGKSRLKKYTNKRGKWSEKNKKKAKKKLVVKISSQI